MATPETTCCPDSVESYQGLESLETLASAMRDDQDALYAFFDELFASLEGVSTEVESELHQFAERYAAAEEELSAARRELETRSERFESELAERRAQFEAERAEFEQESEQSRQELARLRAELEEERAALEAEIVRQRSVLEEDLHRQREEIDQARTLFETHRESLNVDWEEQKVRLAADQETLRDTWEQMQAGWLSQRETLLDALDQRLSQLAAEREAWRHEQAERAGSGGGEVDTEHAASLQRALERLEKELDAAHEQAARAEQARRDAQKERETLETELHATLEKVSELSLTLADQREKAEQEKGEILAGLERVTESVAALQARPATVEAPPVATKTIEAIDLALHSDVRGPARDTAREPLWNSSEKDEATGADATELPPDPAADPLLQSVLAQFAALRKDLADQGMPPPTS